MSRNDIRMSRNDIKKARNDIKKAHPVDFRALVAARIESTDVGVTHYRSIGYGKIARNRSAICDQKEAF